MAAGLILVTVTGPVSPAAASYPGHIGRLAFGVEADGNMDIYSVLPTGTSLHRLTDYPGFDGCPSFSADGRDIVFCRNEGGPVEIWMMTANGKKQHRVVSLGGFSVFPDFSPDGSKVVFSGARPGSNINIWVVARDGTKLRQLTTSSAGVSDLFPVWSPDGSTILFVSNRSGSNQLWTMDADGSDQRQLTFDATTKWQVPDWSPDGQRIAYQADDDIWVADADGTHQVRLTATPAVELGTAWAPDGSKIAFARGDTLAWSQVYVMNADGSEAHVVRATAGRQIVPAWQPL
jgi:TolB protein